MRVLQQKRQSAYRGQSLLEAVRFEKPIIYHPCVYNGTKDAVMINFLLTQASIKDAIDGYLRPNIQTWGLPPEELV